MWNFRKYETDIESLNKRAKEIVSVKVEGEERKKILKDILGVIDLTTLSGDDTNTRVAELCEKALSFRNDDKNIPNVAAVCVYPVFAKLVSEKLKDSDVKTACVAGAFPSGLSPMELREKEVEFAVENGADEIDMVISRGKLLEDDEDFVFDEISNHKIACFNAHLKVILETGELKTVEKIRRACEIAILSGADFLKTSTGKIQPAATHEAFLIMLDTIKDYHNKTRAKIGIKAAGGISTPDEAIGYYLLVKEILGEEWLNKDFFRIGASRLADGIFNELN